MAAPMDQPAQTPAEQNPAEQNPAEQPGDLWIGTSWKMNKTLAQARDYARGLARALRERPAPHEGAADTSGEPSGGVPGVQAFVIPPATALAAVAEELGEDSPVLLGAQDAHWEDAGAWTGEVSAAQVADAGAQILEIGHSERRQHFAETVERTALKTAAALRHGMVPLLCIGEDLQTKEAGGSAEFILEQARGALSGLSAEQLARVVIAYEPVWAIGTSGRPATPEELTEPFARLAEEYGSRVQTVLYGGSVNLDNAQELLGIPGVGGLFVGRTAWELEGYLRLLEIGARAAAAHGRRRG